MYETELGQTKVPIVRYRCPGGQYGAAEGTYGYVDDDVVAHLSRAWFKIAETWWMRLLVDCPMSFRVRDLVCRKFER